MSSNQLFPFAMMAVPVQTIASDLISVEPMPMPSGDLFYMDYHINNHARIRKLDKLLRSKSKRWVVCKRRSSVGDS